MINDLWDSDEKLILELRIKSCLILKILKIINLWILWAKIILKPIFYELLYFQIKTFIFIRIKSTYQVEPVKILRFEFIDYLIIDI